MKPEELTPRAVTNRLISNLRFSSPEMLEGIISSKLPEYIRQAIAGETKRCRELVVYFMAGNEAGNERGLLVRDAIDSGKTLKEIRSNFS